jgi:enoyl-CoA hydratase
LANSGKEKDNAMSNDFGFTGLRRNILTSACMLASGLRWPTLGVVVAQTPGGQGSQAMAQPNSAERWGGLDPTPPPADMVEPKDPILLEYVSGGRIAIITFNRPQANNSMNTAMSVRFTEILAEIAARPSVRVAVLTGAGKVFCHGGDLRERKDMTTEQWLRQRAEFDRTLYLLRNLRRPIFAAVNGLALGGGAEMAESVDFIIASEHAGFGQPEAMVGLSAGGGSPALLPRLLPPGMAMQMLMTGEPISAQEAYRLGMVNKVYPQADLMRAALEIAEKIARNSPTAVQAVKHAAKAGQGEALEQAVGIMMEDHWISVGHPDRLEGSKAWNERREPKYPDPAR